MKKITLIFLIILSFGVEAKENTATDSGVERRAFPMSWKYKAGVYLVYDCEDEHFACVNENSWKRCEDRRRRDKEAKKAQLSCAPLKRLSSSGDCLKIIYEKVHFGVNKGFCRNRFRKN